MGQVEARAELERIRKCGQDQIHDAVDYETLDSVLVKAFAESEKKDPLPIFVKPYNPTPKEPDQEARGEVFGVGDIVELPNNEFGGFFQVLGQEIRHQSQLQTDGVNMYKLLRPKNTTVSSEIAFVPIGDKDLKLIFPASRIPKELGGIRCEPKGDVVELKGGAVGMVLTIIPPYNFPYLMLSYDDVNNVWYTISLKKENLARVIWPL